MPIYTEYSSKIINEESATALYEYLRDNISWEEGIRSKKGFTRLAKSINPVDYEEIINIINDVLVKMKKDSSYLLLGIYLNFYANGEMYTPNHTHKDTHQLIISLGATRSLYIGKKIYKMNNGDAIIFGSSIHGVPKEPAVTTGRISIAVFLKPLT